jgi:MFS family permease
VSLLVSPERKGLALGAVGLVRILPIFVFSLIAGVVADAVNRRRLLLITQTWMLLVATALAVITLRGLTVLWPLYALTAALAGATTLDIPARQSLFPNLVPREHLPNAISLNTIMFQTASVLGPALGGLLIARVDIGWVYALNAVSYLAVIGALLLMRDVPGQAPGARQEISLKAALEGLRFVFRAPLIRSTMLLDFFASFFASAYKLLPIFAQDILKVGSEGYGLLTAAPSVGSMLTGLFMVRYVDRIDHRGRTLLWSVGVFGLATVVFGLSRSFWLALLCLAATGASDTVSTVLRNIIRQLITPDHMRGRMTSVNMIFYVGGPELGEAEAGVLADWIGAPLSVITGGLAAMLATLWVARTTPALRDYRRDDALAAAQPAPAD